MKVTFDLNETQIEAMQALGFSVCENESKTSGEPILLKGHQDEVYSAEWSPDGKLIVTVSYDKTARVWNAFTGKLLQTIKHDCYVYEAKFSPDGSKIMTRASDNYIRIYPCS